MRGKSLRSGLLLAVGILAVAGVAGAATGHGGVRTLSEPVPTTETTEPPETTSPETTLLDTTTTESDEPADEAELAGESAPVVEPPADTPPYPCAEGNHGKTVSEVARDTPSGPGHGQAVSEAAKSDCGKATHEADDESTEPEAADESEAAEADDVDVADDARPTVADTEQRQPREDQDHGKSNGKGERP